MAMVCLCHGVSDRTVDKAIARGAITVDLVGDACRAGTSCGVCRETIQAKLAVLGLTPVGLPRRHDDALSSVDAVSA